MTDRPTITSTRPAPPPVAGPPTRPRRRHLVVRGIAALAASALAAGALVAVSAAPANAYGSTTLAEAAAGTKRYFGTAVKANLLGEDASYTNLLTTHFNSVTAENEMKPSNLRPSGSTYNWGPADEIVNFGYNRGWKVRGHTLAWHSQQGFMAGMSGAQLRSSLDQYMRDVMGRYRGKIYAWDVVNEAFADGCATEINPPRSPCPRRSSNLQSSGNDWIEWAFTRARTYDPDAKLCYNDYDIDNWTHEKTQAVYAMVQDFKNRGVPIDCVGFQAHFNNNPGSRFDFYSFRTTLINFAELGVDVQITELDVEDLDFYTVYRSVASICQAILRCNGITTWGFRDTDSWRYQPDGTGTRLLFNGTAKHPWYDAMLYELDSGDCSVAQTWDIPIPDASYTYDFNSPVSCTAVGPGNSRLEYRVVHPRVGDLRIELYAPDGTQYLVRNRVHVSGSTHSGTFTFTPNNTPENASGYWVIVVRDEVSGSTGYLDSWTLSV